MLFYLTKVYSKFTTKLKWQKVCFTKAINVKSLLFIKKIRNALGNCAETEFMVLFFNDFEPDLSKF